MSRKYTHKIFVIKIVICCPAFYYYAKKRKKKKPFATMFQNKSKQCTLLHKYFSSINTNVLVLLVLVAIAISSIVKVHFVCEYVTKQSTIISFLCKCDYLIYKKVFMFSDVLGNTIKKKLSLN